MGLSWDEWTALPWHVKRTYLEGMEQDESVPLSFEASEQEGPAGVMSGLPDGFTPEVRQADPNAVINIGGMIADLDAARSSRGR
jgi:hypothetical protein